MDKSIAQQVIEAARMCCLTGLQTGTGGNFSVRASAGTMLVKPAGYSFADCTIENLAETDFKANITMPGMNKPSKESKLHGFLYQEYPDINCILHCHSPYVVSWSLTEENLPAVTRQFALKFGESIPNLMCDAPIVPVSYFADIKEAINRYCVRGIICFILHAHGIVACGKSVKEALNLVELAEETAKVAVISSCMGLKPKNFMAD